MIFGMIRHSSVLSESEELFELSITQKDGFDKEKFSTKSPPPAELNLREVGILCKYSNENMSAIWRRFFAI